MKRFTLSLLILVIISSCGTSKKELKSTIANCEKKVEQVEKEKEEIAEESEEKSEKIKTLKKEVKTVNDSINKISSSKSLTSKKGVYYRIQLGATKVASSTNDSSDFLVKEGAYYKWRVGYFKSYDEAKMALKDLKRFGVKKYWIVPMKDGKVISHKEAKRLLAKSE